MSDVLHFLSLACLLIGSVLNIIAAFGFFAFRDVYSKMHATGVTDTLGTGLILLGLALQTGWDSALGKLLLILAFSLFTNPTVSYVIANTAKKNKKGGQSKTKLRRGES